MGEFSELMGLGVYLLDTHICWTRMPRLTFHW